MFPQGIPVRTAGEEPQLPAEWAALFSAAGRLDLASEAPSQFTWCAAHRAQKGCAAHRAQQGCGKRGMTWVRHKQVRQTDKPRERSRKGRHEAVTAGACPTDSLVMDRRGKRSAVAERALAIRGEEPGMGMYSRHLVGAVGLIPPPTPTAIMTLTAIMCPDLPAGSALILDSPHAC